MNTKEMIKFSNTMKLLAEDFDFGENEILAIHFTRHIWGNAVEVMLSNKFDIYQYAQTLNELVDETKDGNLTRKYFNHGGVQYFQLISD